MVTADLEHSPHEFGFAFGTDDDSHFGQTVTASQDEIRYAEQLRLQVRESYQRRPVPPPSLWCVGVD